MTAPGVALLLVACGGSPEDTAAAEAVVPPDWLWQSAAATVEPERGWSWELDPDFALRSAAVPQVFQRSPGGWGMLVTDMRDPDSMIGRSLATSADGTNWSDPEPLVAPDAFAVDCGHRFEDGAVWIHEDGTYRYLLEGTEPDTLAGRRLCHATARDGEDLQPQDTVLFAGGFEGDSVSVPALVQDAGGRAILYYNGDLADQTAAGSGIRVAALDPDTLAAELLATDPILSGLMVDPMPVYEEGGGLRLYLTRSGDEEGASGLGVVELDGWTEPRGEVASIFDAKGACGKTAEGWCAMDPSFARLPDGTLHLYFSSARFEAGQLAEVHVWRLVATD